MLSTRPSAMSVGEAERLDTPEADETSGELTPVDYEAGEPESEEPEDDDTYMSEEDDDEVDELVDEVDESEVPETNRRSRRAPLRITLKRKSVKETPPRRKSARAPKRSARARQMDDGASRAGEDVEEDDEGEDDELEGDDSDEASNAASEAPMTARQLARANRARGLSTEELVELPMGMPLPLTQNLPRKRSSRKRSSHCGAPRRRAGGVIRANASLKTTRSRYVRATYLDYQSSTEEAGRQSAGQGRQRRRRGR